MTERRERHLGSNVESHQKTLEKAEFILRGLGLSWKDLEGKRTLDIGAGNGVIGKIAKQKGYDVVSYDIEPHWNQAVDLKNAYEYLTNSRIKTDPDQWLVEARKQKFDIPYVQGDASSLPFYDDVFDLIISRVTPPSVETASIEEATRIFSEIKRVLKTGGEYRQSHYDTSMSRVFPAAESFDALALARERLIQKQLPGAQIIDTTQEDQHNANYYRFIKSR